MNLVVALIFFPLLLVVLTLALHTLIGGELRFGSLRVPPMSGDSVAAGASLLLAACGLALLPWPFSPVPLNVFGAPLTAWLATEGAFLIALLPGLLIPDALINRATIREAQISLAGRVVLWLAIGTLVWTTANWTALSLPGRLLLALGGVFALPAAAGLGPFSADRSLSPLAAERGLDQATLALVQFARQARGTLLFAALGLALVPRTQVQPVIGIVLWFAIVLVGGLILRRLNGRIPRLTLPAILHWCWQRALPVALVGLLYLAVVRA